MAQHEALTSRLSDSTILNNSAEMNQGGLWNFVANEMMESRPSLKYACGGAEEHLPEVGFEEEGGAQTDEAADDQQAQDTTEEPAGETATDVPAEDEEVNRCPF